VSTVRRRRPHSLRRCRDLDAGFEPPGRPVEFSGILAGESDPIVTDCGVGITPDSDVEESPAASRSATRSASGVGVWTVRDSTSPPNDSAISSNIAFVSSGMPGSTETFSITQPGARPGPFNSGRLPSGIDASAS